MSACLQHNTTQLKNKILRVQTSIKYSWNAVVHLKSTSEQSPYSQNLYLSYFDSQEKVGTKITVIAADI